MTTRYQEKVFIYDGVRKVVRVYSQMIPEDFVMSMSKAEAATFKLNEAVSVVEPAQEVKDSVAFLDMEI